MGLPFRQLSHESVNEDELKHHSIQKHVLWQVTLDTGGL